MSNRVSLSPRDLSQLRLLSWTPATTALLLRASTTFDGEPFTDERRLRERLQGMSAAGVIRSWPTAHAGGGLQNYYKLTSLGFELLHGTEMPQPSRAFFSEVSPSLFDHTFRLAEVIVETVRASHSKRVTIERFIRENELTFAAGDAEVQPDCFFRLSTGGRAFNLAFEIDQSTESVGSHAASSIRRKISIYHAYQERVLEEWLRAGKTWERPRFRVVFLTKSVERAYHILALAAETAATKSRRLVLAATFDTYVTEVSPLHAPSFLDHLGTWQSLVDLHPTASYQKAPIRLARSVESPLGVG